MQDNDIKAIYIASPVSTHFNLIKMGIENGKYIFCEKVLVNDKEELEYIKKNNDKLEETEIVEILENPAESAKKIKEIEKKGKEKKEIDFDDKIQKLNEKIEKAYKNM